MRYRDAVTSFATVLAREPGLRRTLATRADGLAIRDAGRSSIALVAAACQRFADRPCLGERVVEPDARGTEVRLLPRFRVLTFAQLWTRVAALASGWAHDGLVRNGEFVGVCGFAGVDWVVADLACLYGGAVGVPLPTSLPAADLLHVIREASLSSIVISAADVGLIEPLLPSCPGVRSVVVMDLGAVAPVARGELDARLARWPVRVVTIEATEARGATAGILPHAIPGADERGANPLVSVVYTSGSAGPPKGVMYREEEWRRRLEPAMPDTPQLVLGCLPLCHIMGRSAVLFLTLMNGGMTCFVARRDLSTLFADAQLVGPTVMWVVPRISAWIQRRFEREPRRDLLGDRLCRVYTGAAPTAPEVVDFLEKTFGVEIIDVYGAAELGSLTYNGRFHPGIAYKLEDVPELGYHTTDRPYPRGELLVKTSMGASGYYQAAAADAALVDAEGYRRTGDIVEERGPGWIAVVDRATNIVKLAQGEYVAVARLEELFTRGSPLVQQIYLHVSGRRAYLVAVIVPDPDALARAGPGEVKAFLRPSLRAWRGRRVCPRTRCRATSSSRASLSAPPINS